MHSLPPWYGGLVEFNYIFHSIFDLLFIIFGLLIVVVVSRPGWNQHLRWASPAAVSSILDGLNRLALDMHHYFGLGARLNIYLTSDLFNYGAVLLSFYSIVMLWRTLRELTRLPASPAQMALQSLHGVWPPPPTVPPRTGD